MAIVQLTRNATDETIDVGADGGRMTVLLVSDEFTVHLGVNEAVKLRDDISEAIDILTVLLTSELAAVKDGYEDTNG